MRTNGDKQRANRNHEWRLVVARICEGGSGAGIQNGPGTTPEKKKTKLDSGAKHDLVSPLLRNPVRQTDRQTQRVLVPSGSRVPALNRNEVTPRNNRDGRNVHGENGERFALSLCPHGFDNVWVWFVFCLVNDYAWRKKAEVPHKAFDETYGISTINIGQHPPTKRYSLFIHSHRRPSRLYVGCYLWYFNSCSSEIHTHNSNRTMPNSPNFILEF